MDDVDTFIYTSSQSMKNVDKIMNSDTRVKVVQTGLTRNIVRWTHRTIIPVICATKKIVRYLNYTTRL
jgi:hypothetical protein